MVELGYKHGPFDFRYRVPQKLATPVWELRPDRDGPGSLGWSAFLARFFPTRRRHDFEVLAAYEGYRNALDRAASREGRPTRLPALATGGNAEVVVNSALADRIIATSGAVEAASTVSPSPALADWESEGGSLERSSLTVPGESRSID